MNTEETNRVTEQEASEMIQEVAREFFLQRSQKSFSERHPELGKMVNCPVCNERHRSARICVPSYAKGVDGEPRIARLTAVYPPRRKHRNAWGLQVLERALKIYREDRACFKELSVEEEDKLGKACLSRALNEKRAERAEYRRNHLLITKASRKLNRGSR